MDANKFLRGSPSGSAEKAFLEFCQAGVEESKNISTQIDQNISELRRSMQCTSSYCGSYLYQEIKLLSFKKMLIKEFLRCWTHCQNKVNEDSSSNQFIVKNTEVKLTLSHQTQPIAIGLIIKYIILYRFRFWLLYT